MSSVVVSDMPRFGDETVRNKDTYLNNKLVSIKSNVSAFIYQTGNFFLSIKFSLGT